MTIILLIMYAKAIYKEELYEYQVGMILTNKEEDFILNKPNPNDINFRNEGFIINDEKVVLISEINHNIDKIIDMKQNQYVKEDYVWILFQMDNKSILSKQSIDNLQNKENHYLQINFECYTFYFISKSQIVIDCQDSISNIIVLYDIKNKIQQSFYYSYYKVVKLRKLMQVQKSNSLILIQKDQFLFVCLIQNKYQICNEFTFQNNAHAVHICEYQITLISDYLVDVFEVIIEDVYKIAFLQTKNFSQIELESNHPLLYYFHNPFNKQQYLVYDQSLLVCSENCFKIQMDGKPIQVQVFSYYFSIQTNNWIYIVYMKNGDTFKIEHQYNNDSIATNQNLHEVLLLNTDQLKFYGLTQSPYTRVKNQSQLILIDNSFYYLKSSIDDLSKESIIFYEQFKFKIYYNFPVTQNIFVAIGGSLNLTFIVENEYKDLIKIKQSYFLENQHKDVKYFFFRQNKIKIDFLIIINRENKILSHNLQNIHKLDYILEANNLSENLAFSKQISNFTDAYYFYNTINGQNLVMRLQMDKINFVEFQCLQNYQLLWCNSRFCICQNSLQIYIKLLDKDPGIYLQKSEEDLILNIDYVSDTIVLYIKNSDHLIIKYYNNERSFFSQIHTQSIKLCNDFINLVIFQFKLIMICSGEVILYNRLSNFRFVISGNVDLYGEWFSYSSKVKQSTNHLYYIIDNQILYVFNSFLSLQQQYVTKMEIGEFDDVKVHNKNICFQYKNNLKCYYYSINIQFHYDSDQVEYHQAFKVNVCAENKYNKKCKQYITRIDQQNRAISIYKNINQFVINENTTNIKLNSKFYSGSVDKIYVNNLQLKPKRLAQAYLQLHSDYNHKSYYNGYQNLIYLLNNQSLIIYNIETRQTYRMNTKKRMFHALQYKKNLVLFGPYSISVVNCEIDCKELQYLEKKIPPLGLLYIINNTLYSIILGQINTFNLDDLQQNKSSYSVDVESNIYQIDVQQDKNGQICMVYLSYNGSLEFKHLQNTKSYQILSLLKQKGVHLDWMNPDAIYSAKILDNCRLVLLGTGSGQYFLELSDEIIFHAQIAVQDPQTQRMGQLLIGQSYIFYIQILSDSLAIYKFTYYEIYHNKFIDYCKKLYKSHSHQIQNEDYFQAYKDELYQVQQRFNEYIINKIDLDTDIRFEKVGSKEKILIELSNSDETKSFIIELIVEKEEYGLIFSTISGLLIIFYILLIYYKINKRLLL